jgi:hypothetical protein
MKIKSGGIQTEVSAGINELVFRVDDEDQGFIFEMLRSKIYSDPIAAICREIAANARDANREVGNGKIPITIGMRQEDPMSGDSSLHLFFKDNGPGISPDRMANVFCKYAKSTKRDTDELTGGFGLGAKTPFAYTDAFTIITNVDGTKYTYTAYIDESRRGKIAKLAETPTDEANGTTIMVPIQPYDKDKFERMIHKYTFMWDVWPVYENMEMEEFVDPAKLDSTLVNLPSGRQVTIVRAGSAIFHRAHGIIVDGMPYDLDISQCDNYKGCSSVSTVEGMQIIVHASTGEVDLSVNRETIQYTPMTIGVISPVIDELAKHFSSMAESYICDAPSYFEACLRLHCIVNRKPFPYDTAASALSNTYGPMATEWMRLYMPKSMQSMFEYGGKRVMSEFPRMRGIRFQLAYYNDNGNVAYRDISFSIRQFFVRPIYELDVATRSMDRTSRILNEAKSAGKAGEFILVSKKKFNPPRGNDPAELADALAAFNSNCENSMKEWQDLEAPVIKYSSVPATDRSKSAAGARNAPAPVTVMSVRMVKLPNVWGDIKKSIATVDVSVRRGSGPVDGNGQDIQHKVLYIVSSDIVSVPELTREKINIAWFIMQYYGMPMYIVPKRLANHFADCLDIDTAIDGLDKSIVKKTQRAMHILELYSNVVDSGLDRIAIGDPVVSGQVKTLSRMSKLLRRTAIVKSLKAEDVLSYVTDRYAVKKQPDEFPQLRAFMAGIHAKYPLLKSIGNLKYAHNIEDINEYVRLIDAERERKKREARRASKASASAGAVVAVRMPAMAQANTI